MSHRYSNHSSIIKFIDFELIYYAIDLGIALSYIVFSEFVFVFLLMYRWFKSIKLFYFFKKNSL